MLCPLLSRWTALPRWLGGLAVALAAGLSLPVAWAQTPDTAEAVLKPAREWVAKNQQLAPEQVRFAPLDSRLRLQGCSEALVFDYPFSSSRETLRVRCSAAASPWQLYLRLLPPQLTQAPLPGGPTATAPPATRTVVVTRRLVQRGGLLDASVAEEVQRPAQGLDALAVSSLKDVEQAEALRDLPAGTVLRSYDIKRALMVRKGQTATMTLGQGQGFQVTVRVEAQQDGHMGEQIRLKNPDSGRLLSGVVTGPNAVRGLPN